MLRALARCGAALPAAAAARPASWLLAGAGAAAARWRTAGSPLLAAAPLSRGFTADAAHADFDLTPEQQEFKSVAEAFAREELLHFGPQWDQAHHFPVVGAGGGGRQGDRAGGQTERKLREGADCNGTGRRVVAGRKGSARSVGTSSCRPAQTALWPCPLQDTLRKAAELGFAAMYVSEEHGGERAACRAAGVQPALWRASSPLLTSMHVLRGQQRSRQRSGAAHNAQDYPARIVYLCDPVPPAYGQTVCCRPPAARSGRQRAGPAGRGCHL